VPRADCAGRDLEHSPAGFATERVDTHDRRAIHEIV
jgi:hypothetical protein